MLTALEPIAFHLKNQIPKRKKIQENQIPNSKSNAYGLRAYSLSSEKSNSKKEKQISKKIMFQIPKLTAENKKLRIFNFHFFRTGNLNIIS